MNSSIANLSNSQFSFPKVFLLHIIPGFLTTLALMLFKPLFDLTGFPPLLAFLLAVLLIDIPVMLGVMFNEGKKLNGRFSLEGVVLYREKVSWKTFLLVFIGAFIVLYLLLVLNFGFFGSKSVPENVLLKKVAVFSNIFRTFFL